jgi:hypothetical protein
MASEIDLCNIALGHLGDSATVTSINPPEGSVQAEHCARFYPIARDALLERHAWSFASRTQLLVPLAIDLPATWKYAYASPVNALSIHAVYSTDATDEEIECGEAVPWPFVLAQEPLSGTRVIYTDLELAVARYTISVQDSALFPALFNDTLAKLLASYLAGPIYKGVEGQKMARAMLQMAEASFGVSAAADSNQRRIRGTHVPSWIAARG